MIIRITYDKGMHDESFVNIYCPNRINIKRKNLKSKFFEWYDILDNEENELIIKISEEIESNGLEIYMIYWINNYLLDYDYGDKAYLLKNNEKFRNNYDINVLESGIRPDNKEALKLIAEGHENVSIRFYNVKEKMANNEELLAQISTDKQKEQQRLVSEKAAAEAQKKRAAETAKAEAAKKQAAADKQAQADAAAKLEAEAAEESSSQASSSSTSTESSSTESSSSASSSESSSTTESSTGESSTPGTGSGRVLQMESTAYSWREAGASNLSATGIDLSKESNVVAVDPSVIPLGSLVKVSGYGFAIAGDTGGAIQGNIIDVHFDSVDQCRLWGRRQVTVEIQ